MHNAIPLFVAVLVAVAIIVIGCFYLASPERILGSFGLKPPASDADTRADRKSTRLNSSHRSLSRMPSSA